MKRPTKDEYYMHVAYVVSERSLDPRTKHGCISVSQEGSILSTGYNGPPRGVNDNLVPLTDPEKYLYMIHCEANCIYNVAMNGTALKGCTFYVTGIPCPKCLQAMYQVGAEEIVMLERESVSTDDDWYEMIRFLNPYIRIREIKI